MRQEPKYFNALGALTCRQFFWNDTSPLRLTMEAMLDATSGTRSCACGDVKPDENVPSSRRTFEGGLEKRLASELTIVRSVYHHTDTVF